LRVVEVATSPRAFAARAISSASEKSSAIGFSTSTWQPLASAASATFA
jgi:hypothetical protein